MADNGLLKGDMISSAFKMSIATQKVEPMEDNPEVMPVCYRCGSTNSILSNTCDKSGSEPCTNCGHPFIRCFINFDVLPLVEFAPCKLVTDEDAIALIQAETKDEDDEIDLFSKSINTSLFSQESQNYSPTLVDERTLKSIDCEEVFMLHPLKSGTTTRFFKNTISDIGISVCRYCHHFFHEQDFEFSVLEGDGCVVCRKSSRDYGHV